MIGTESGTRKPKSGNANRLRCAGERMDIEREGSEESAIPQAQYETGRKWRGAGGREEKNANFRPRGA